MKKLILKSLALLFAILATLANSTLLVGQVNWQQTNGPSGAHIYFVHAAPDGFVYTLLPDYYSNFLGSPLYRSENAAESWEMVAVFDYIESISGIDANGIIYANGIGSLLRSTDHGISWQNVLTLNAPVYLLDAPGDTLYCYGENLSMSVDNGLSWTETNADIQYDPLLINSAGYLIRMANSQDVLISHDSGVTWDAFASINGTIYSSDISPQDEIFISNYGDGIYRISADGTESTLIAEDISMVEDIEIIPDGTIFIRAEYGRLYVSNNNGESWQLSSEGLLSSPSGPMDADPAGNVYFGWSEGIQRSVNNGQSWQNATEGILHASARSIASSLNGDIYARQEYRVTMTDDYGDSWQQVFSASTHSAIHGLYTLADSNVYVITTDPFNINFYGDCIHDSCMKMYMSTDDGQTWLKVLYAGLMHDLLVNHEGVLFLSTDTGVMTSYNQGLSWQTAYTGELEFFHLVVDSSGFLYGQSEEGIYWSNDNAVTWQFASPPQVEDIGSYHDFDINSSGMLYTVTAYNYEGSAYWRVSRSIDNGATWSNLSAPDTLQVTDLYVGLNDYLYLSTGEGVLKSMDNGDTWENISPQATFTSCLSVTEDPAGRLYASFALASVYKYDPFVNIQTIPSSSPSIKLFPNPAKGEVEVIFNSNEVPATLYIYDISGKAIITTYLISNRIKLNISDLKPGIYTIKVNSSATKLVVR